MYLPTIYLLPTYQPTYYLVHALGTYNMHSQTQNARMEYQICALKAAVLFNDIEPERPWSGEKEKRKKEAYRITRNIPTNDLLYTLRTRKIMARKRIRGRKKRRNTTQHTKNLPSALRTRKPQNAVIYHSNPYGWMLSKERPMHSILDALPLRIPAALLRCTIQSSDRAGSLSCSTPKL